MSYGRSLLVGLLGVGVGAGLCTALLPKPAPPPVTKPANPNAPKKVDPPYRDLDANLYMRTSAEYRACCLQAYHWAALRVEEKLKAKAGQGKPPAVVLDLDETVLDNGASQAVQVRNAMAFDKDRWKEWERHDGGKLDLVPGAKGFVAKLKAAGVQPVYVTNRDQEFDEQLLASLDRLGVGVPAAQLASLPKGAATSSKKSRQGEMISKYDVLLWVGDNLRDFEDETFLLDQDHPNAARRKAVDDREEKFGTDYIILPNPAYGDWTRGFTNSVKDADLLSAPTKKD